MDIVVVTSKLCNLRCRYCYELPLLGDRARISLDQLDRAFVNLASYFADVERPTTLRFCWHGGEPLLTRPDYYWEALERQRTAFAGTHHSLTNHVQTNLTVLDGERIDLLRHGFDAVGVSFDVVGGLRVNRNEQPSGDLVLANLDRLRAAGVEPAGITVLSRPNVRHVRAIYDFWRDRDMDFRLLPVEPGLYEPGQSFELSPQEILRALCTLADVWFEDAAPIRIEPIHSFIERLMVSATAGQAVVTPYDLAAHDEVVLIETNGELLAYPDGFDYSRSSGNLFNTPYREILEGEAHAHRVARAQAAIATSCAACPRLDRTCNGHHVAEGGATMHEHRADGSLRCVVARGLFDHVEDRLRQAGVLRVDSELSDDYLACIGGAA